MTRGAGIAVPNDRIREHAERLAARPVERSALSLAFSESTASSVEVHVEGRNFYPPMLEDIAGATSSIHINQFGFRPGVVGDAFAEALVAKAAEGVRVRLIVDGQGTDPDGSSRPLYERLTAAGVEVCVVRATKVRALPGPFGGEGEKRWNLATLGHIDHRKVVIVDGRVGWVGGAGIEDHFQDGRFHDLFLRAEGPVVAQLQLVFLASFRWLGGSIPSDDVALLFPELEAGPEAVPAVVLHNAPGALPADQRRDRAHPGHGRRDARRREPLRDRPRDDPPDRAGGAPRRSRSALRAREPEQLGVRGRPALPPREPARRRRPDPRVPDDAAREGVRPGRRGAARRAPATSRPGA